MREVSEIQQHLTAFEQKYRLASDEFYESYEAGQLEDSANFMQWSSFYDLGLTQELVRHQRNQVFGKNLVSGYCVSPAIDHCWLYR